MDGGNKRSSNYFTIEKKPRSLLILYLVTSFKMSDGNLYVQVADMFLKRYKDLIIAKFKGNSECEITRFKNLVESNAFANEIASASNRLCHVYDNTEWHSIILDTLELDLIYSNVDKMPRENEDEYTDNLVKELLRYFKDDFFTWCDKPICHTCGNNDNQNMTSVDQANAEEQRYQCGPVEIYHCNACGNSTRFPRYNDPIKLLDTRTGRCGEWCNLFTLILKSFGLEVRYVVNREDHVWCEYFSPFLKRWVHVDSCEKAFDQPYIYSVNWNKSMSYCIAYYNNGVVDVSKRYITQNQLPRDQIREDDLRFLCEFLTKQLRKGLSNDDIYSLACRDEQEKLEWAPKMEDVKVKRSSSIKGRQSGTAEWTASRGENGH